jgi:hypothetical protein
VWIDPRLDNGQWEEINRVAIQDCAAMVVVMSQDAQRSKLVQNEVKQAKAAGKPILPLLLSGKSWTSNYMDVTNHTLPERQFYISLAKHAPYKKGHGRAFEPADVMPYATLRYTGMYVAETPNGKDYLRFFADGTVLQQTNPKADEEAIFNNLDEHHPRKANRGQYTVTERAIKFTIKVGWSKIEAEGTIDEDRIDVQWLNHRDRKMGHRIYEFVRVDVHH